mmetsp:Transcript_80677/g.205029  ORF Transcript_80677/g.205029 Transcript_80677/m.205029 type:complete len:89 (-) Transcript_80677:118-384(-)
MLAKARQACLPLKVRLPKYTMPMPAPPRLDPAFPAKKRLVFGDLAAMTAAVLQKLQPGEPVKKKPTSFLTAEPPCVLRPPPGFAAAPR